MIPIPPVAPAELSEHLGGTNATTETLEACISEATGLVAVLLKDVLESTPPTEALVKRAVLDTAADLYARKSAPNGVKSYADLDGTQTVRLRLDPLAQARATLAPFLKLGVA
ncbi:MAG: hypothetical protein MSC45_05300 [Mobiluncus sp.]|uniref:hypothetical protein n=1 Tax=Mobiluncus sp. TaxID=47293 RepID=UPI00258CC0B1|nr:hypothetical protein [Mobiluncus sp.]MCI6584467.1 hypothetical protein [Mobiluncus sp.]